MRRLRTLVPLLALPVLGCSAPNPILAAISCPQYAVLYQASTVTRFAPGAAQLPANAVLTAAMSDLELACIFDFEQNQTEIDLRFVIGARRGPAAAAGQTQQTLPYFVAVLGPDQSMISKELFQRVVDPGNRPFVNTNIVVSDTVLRLAANTQVGQYQVLVGFQLTPEELAYNTAQAGAPVGNPAP